MEDDWLGAEGEGREVGTKAREEAKGGLRIRQEGAWPGEPPAAAACNEW